MDYFPNNPGQLHYTITAGVRFGWILGDRTGRDTISAQLVQRTQKRSMDTVHGYPTRETRIGTARRLLCIPEENRQSIRSHETAEGNEEGI
jgi:hypothetical protein